MDTAFTPTIDGFLARHNVMSLAVAGEGTLWAACVFYAFDRAQRRLLYVTSLDTTHGRLALSNPSVVATVAPQGRDIAGVQGVQIRGLSTMLQGQEAADAKALFLAYFPEVGAVPAPIWALVPDYVKMVDNTVGFGHKEEWPRSARADGG